LCARVVSEAPSRPAAARPIPATAGPSDKAAHQDHEDFYFHEDFSSNS
jgi:hypothetical protein